MHTGAGASVYRAVIGEVASGRERLCEWARARIAHPRVPNAGVRSRGMIIRVPDPSYTVASFDRDRVWIEREIHDVNVDRLRPSPAAHSATHAPGLGWAGDARGKRRCEFAAVNDQKRTH